MSSLSVKETAHDTASSDTSESEEVAVVVPDENTNERARMIAPKSKILVVMCGYWSCHCMMRRHGMDPMFGHA